MKKKITYIKSKIIQYKTLVENFSYLSILQIFSLAVPLITYPYLIITLGLDKYGLVVFAQVSIGYLLTIVNFGFNISGIREVSLHRNKKDKLIEIVSSIIIIKVFLALVCLLFLYCILTIFIEDENYKNIFLLSFWVCLYDITFPKWYFEGTEKMKFITIIILVERLLYICLVFIVIKNSSDYLKLPLISGISALVTSIIPIVIIQYKHEIMFKWQGIDILKSYIIKSYEIFISDIIQKVYTSSNKIIIGAFLGMSEVAIYDLADKVVQILKLPQSVLGQILFPKISFEKDIFFVKKAFKLSLIFNLLLFIAAILFSKFIVTFLGGTEMIASQIILCILLLTIPFTAMTNIFGVQSLIAFGFQNIYRKVITLSALLFFINMILIWTFLDFSIINVGIATVLTEMFTTISLFYYCKKNKLWVIN